MKVKTSDLIGPALDWSVAKCEYASTDYLSRFNPSSDWNLGGPIIERERISLIPSPNWTAVHVRRLGYPYSGPTPLIAAMRCYVAFRLGDEVEIPAEVTDAQG